MQRHDAVTARGMQSVVIIACRGERPAGEKNSLSGTDHSRNRAAAVWCDCQIQDMNTITSRCGYGVSVYTCGGIGMYAGRCTASGADRLRDGVIEWSANAEKERHYTIAS